MPAALTLEDKIAFADRIERDPAWFCDRILGTHPWQRQQEIARALVDTRFETGQMRNGRPDAIEAVLRASKAVRPDLRLRGFGLKLTALGNPFVRENQESGDSMVWGLGAW